MAFIGLPSPTFVRLRTIRRVSVGEGDRREGAGESVGARWYRMWDTEHAVFDEGRIPNCTLCLASYNTLERVTNCTFVNHATHRWVFFRQTGHHPSNARQEDSMGKSHWVKVKIRPRLSISW